VFAIVDFDVQIIARILRAPPAKISLSANIGIVDG
jgi:hypothetical protein